MSETREMTAFIFDDAVDVIVEYNADFYKKDPSVGIFTDDMQVSITKVVTTKGRNITSDLPKKEIARLEGLLSEFETDELENEEERQAAAREDAEDAKREED